MVTPASCPEVNTHMTVKYGFVFWGLGRHPVAAVWEGFWVMGRVGTWTSFCGLCLECLPASQELLPGHGPPAPLGFLSNAELSCSIAPAGRHHCTPTKSCTSSASPPRNRREIGEKQEPCWQWTCSVRVESAEHGIHSFIYSLTHHIFTECPLLCPLVCPLFCPRCWGCKQKEMKAITSLMELLSRGDR